MANLLRDRASDNQIDVVLTHPRHQHTLTTMVGLITDLRRCQRPDELYEFQERLFALVLEADQRRAELSRVVKRLDRHQSIPRDAPELETGLDPADVDSWRLESEVFERIGRQYRSIGDALAWRAFGYDRRVIIALSRNDPPGPMSGKTGLAAERAAIAAAWHDDGRFALHHDLTSALRVGDLSVFHADGTVMLHEIKTNQHRRVKQQDRLLIDTSVVLANGGTLPSGFTLVPSDVPFRTELRGLRELLDLAHLRTGVQAGVVSPGRAVIAVSQYAAADHLDADAFGVRFDAELARARRKIGVRTPGHGLTMMSVDLVARLPTRPPWAIYPVAPVVAASLAADGMLFVVCMNPDVIIRALADAGVQARWLQRLDGSEDRSKPLLHVEMRLHDRLAVSSMNLEAIAGLMLELIDLGSWSDQVARTLRGDATAGTRPWTYFADEFKVWH